MSEVELLLVNNSDSYVMDLQKFERLLKREVRYGNVIITEKEIITDKNFEI